jgi:hypothetical protein
MNDVRLLGNIFERWRRFSLLSGQLVRAIEKANPGNGGIVWIESHLRLHSDYICRVVTLRIYSADQGGALFAPLIAIETPVAIFNAVTNEPISLVENHDSSIQWASAGILLSPHRIAQTFTQRLDHYRIRV